MIKKLYFFMWIIALFICPVIPFVIPNSSLSMSALIFQWVCIMLMITFRKSLGIFTRTKDSFLESVLYNVFASEKEKKIIEDTEWTTCLDKDLKLKEEYKNENLDNKQH